MSDLTKEHVETLRELRRLHGLRLAHPENEFNDYHTEMLRADYDAIDAALPILEAHIAQPSQEHQERAHVCERCGVNLHPSCSFLCVACQIRATEGVSR